MKAEVIYLGHKIDAEGLHPTDQKISDIINAPEPRNVSELKAYLGMINYYSKYIGNISTKLAPLYLAKRIHRIHMNFTKMAAVHGQLSEFNQTEGWESYSECMDFYFQANDIKEGDKKNAIF